MRSYIITIPDHEESEKAADLCVKSSNNVGNEFEIEKFDAITPLNSDRVMRDYGLKWNYPWKGQIVDFSTGLKKSAYSTQNQKARVACALSHYTLWKKSIELDENILILEHDAIFEQYLDYKIVEQSPKLAISLNNPRFATRRAIDYVNKIKQSAPDIQGVVDAPYIDDRSIPQGLPGNSAYIIKPSGSKKMLKLVADYGLWPNDAIMCKQLLPQLGCTKKFYTRVQGIRSTTSS
jgi:GR25 family glycosyltransferase involved in LPS biosynthesis